MKEYWKLARLDNVSAIILLALPGLWSLILASNGVPSFKNIMIFIIGALFTRSAGCVINDIIDYKIDAMVSRTKDRPIAAGKISIQNAVFFVLILLFIPLLLILQTNYLSIFIAICSIIPIILYPLMKRITFWPQLFLGVTFGLGALLGWSVVKNTIELPAVIMYIGCIFWIMGFDTIYAFQDIEDDEKIGMKSTAIKFKKNAKIFITICYIIFLVLFLSSVLLHVDLSIKITLLILPFISIFSKIYNLDLQNKRDCLQKFKDNCLFGCLLLVMLIVVLY